MEEKKMKRILAVMVGIMFMAAGLAFAQESTKVGYVDMKKVMNDCKAGKAALVKLEKNAKDKQAAIDKEKKKLETLQADFEKKAAAMSDKDRQDKQKDFQEKVQAFQKMVGQSQQEFNEMQADYTKKVFADMKEAISEIAKTDSFTIILEKTDTSVLYAKDGLDLTNKVMKKMDAQ
jgi:outer membrane protein